jgi:hypothetical protein
MVAGRYRKTQHLIGPEIFPFWFATLRIVLGVEAVIWLVGLIVTFASANTPVGPVMNTATSSLLTMAVFTFGVVTLLFAVFERTGVAASLQRNWSPARLAPRRTHCRGRFQVASEAVADVVVLLWWTGLIHFRDIMPIPAMLQVQLAPVWSELYWPILGYWLFELGVNGLELFNPSAARTNTVLSLIKGVAGCAILVYLLQAGHWVQVDAPSLRPEVVAKIRTGFDQGMRLGLLGTVLVLALKVFVDLWRLVRLAGVAPQDAAA